MVKAVIAAVAVLLLAPTTALLGVAILTNPAANATCFPLTGANADAPAKAPDSETVPETSHVVHPLPAGVGVRTSRYGYRLHPITGEWKLHTGVDYAAPAGTPILAVADGRVAFAGPATGYGNLILITHTVQGHVVVSGYAHMYSADLLVRAGDQVAAGQLIARVGSAGYSTGAHLHLEIRPGGPNGSPSDPEPWLAGHGAVSAGTTEPSGTEAVECSNAATADTYSGGDPDEMVDDPTSTGQITRQTAHVLAQVRENFPASSWSCWSPRTGPSEHPLGCACDGTFGNAIGTAATGSALALGWQVTNWLKTNANVLGVEYLIWQGKIWSVARRDEGWRPYNGGGMHDPGNVTGGHYDHLHFTINR